MYKPVVVFAFLLFLLRKINVVQENNRIMFGFYSKEKLTNIGVSNQEDFGQTFPTPRETTATTTTTENLQPAVVVVKKALPKNRSNKKRQPLGKSQLQLLLLQFRYCFHSELLESDWGKKLHVIVQH